MTVPLDFEVLDPPDLTDRAPSSFEDLETAGSAGDRRREELETAMHDGAWREALEEWAEYTDVDPEEFRALVDHGLVGGIDVFWDPEDGRLRFEVPTVPPSVGSDPDRLENELTDLARVLVKTLVEGYLDWDGIQPENYGRDVDADEADPASEP